MGYRKKKYNIKKNLFIIFVIIFVLISLLIQHIQETTGDIDTAKEKLQLWGNATGETRTHLENFDNSVKELQDKIAYFSYNGLKMSDEDAQSIIERLQGVKSTFNTELDNWYIEQKQVLDDLYSWEGAKDTEEYQKQLEKLKTHVTDKQGEFDTYYSTYEKKLKEFYSNDHKISSDEYLELLDLQEQMQSLSIDAFSKN